MNNMKKIASASIIGLTAIATGGFTSSIAHAVDGPAVPVTFEVTAGSLALVQEATSTALISGGTANLPETAITDGRNNADRTGAWTVTATASDLVAGVGTDDEATILASEITLDQAGAMTSGTGTVGELGMVSVSVNSINSVYTYTPTAALALQDVNEVFSGSYTGTVTQTVT
jgi:hypothetical protein